MISQMERERLSSHFDNRQLHNITALAGMLQMIVDSNPIGVKEQLAASVIVADRLNAIYKGQTEEQEK